MEGIFCSIVFIFVIFIHLLLFEIIIKYFFFIELTNQPV